MFADAADALRVLFVGACPADAWPLDLRGELDGIERGMGRAGVDARLHRVLPPTADQLRTTLRACIDSGTSPHILHIAAHGTPRQLLLEDAEGRADPIDRSRLAELLAGSGVGAVVLSACHSAKFRTVGIARAIADEWRVVEAAVGHREPVPDAAALALTETLYEGIAEGCALGAALRTARRAVSSRWPRAADSLRLHGRADWAPLNAPALGRVRVVDHPAIAGPPTRPVFGRQALLEAADHALSDGRTHTLVLVGIGGSGKTALAAALVDRHRWRADRVDWYAVGERPPEDHSQRVERRLTVIDGTDRVDESSSIPSGRSGSVVIITTTAAPTKLSAGTERLVLLDGLEPEQGIAWLVERLADVPDVGPETSLRILDAAAGHPGACCAGADALRSTGDVAAALMAARTSVHAAIEAALDRCTVSRACIPALARWPSDRIYDAQAAAVLDGIGLPGRWPVVRAELSLVGLLRSEEPGLGHTMHPGLVDYAIRCREPTTEQARAVDSALLVEALSHVENDVPPDIVYSDRGDPIVETFERAWQRLAPDDPRRARIVAAAEKLSDHLLETGGGDRFERWAARAEALAAPDAMTPAARARRALRRGEMHEKRRESEGALRALDVAARLFAEIGDADGQTAVLYQQALVARWQARFDDADSLLSQALANVSDESDTARVATMLHVMAMVASARGEVARSEALATRAMELRDQAENPMGWSAIALLRGQNASAEYRLDDARHWAEASLEIDRLYGDENGIGAALNLLAEVAATTGDIDEARALYEESLAIADEQNDPDGRSANHFQLGRLALDSGERDLARSHLETALRICDATGDDRARAAILRELGTLHRDLGELDDAARVYRDSLHLVETIGDAHGQALVTHELGVLADIAGQPNAAREWYTRSLDASRAIGDEVGVAGSLLPLAGLDLESGAHDQARIRLTEAEALARAAGDVGGVSAALYGRARLMSALGQLPEARRLILQALVIDEDLGDLEAVATYLHALARFERELGRPTQARRLLRRALATAADVDDVETRAACLLDLADLTADDDPDAGAALAKQALAIWTRIGHVRQMAAAHHHLGAIRFGAGDLGAAELHFRQSADLSGQCQDVRNQAVSWAALGQVRAALGGRDEAIGLLDRAETQLMAFGYRDAVRIGDQRRALLAGVDVGPVTVDQAKADEGPLQLTLEAIEAWERGDSALADASLRRAGARLAEVEDPHLRVVVLCAMSRLYIATRRLLEARRALLEADALSRRAVPTAVRRVRRLIARLEVVESA